MPEATVLIPTFDHGPTLRHSVGSVLAQTVEDVEVFIIGDGVPAGARAVVRELTEGDRRVRFFDHPKGPRHGEVYRDRALAEARGRVVCYLSDDDLWAPDHVETMLGLLARADFAHTLCVGLGAAGELIGYWLDLAHPAERAAVLTAEKGVSLGAMAHTLEMYRRLPFGWRTTPKGIPTDRYMQQQFLAEPSCRAASGTRPTMLHFESAPRAAWGAGERLAELERWRARLFDGGGRAEFYCEVIDLLAREHVAAVRGFGDSLTWRLRSRLLAVPFVSSVVRTAARAGGRRPRH
jgi:glycosyltransferase involved in cell wall biosynthesis